MDNKKTPSFSEKLDRLLDEYERSNDPVRDSDLLVAIRKLLEEYQKRKGKTPRA